MSTQTPIRTLKQLQKVIEKYPYCFICPKMTTGKPLYELWCIDEAADVDSQDHKLRIIDIEANLVTRLKKGGATFPHCIYTLLKFKLTSIQK